MIKITYTTELQVWNPTPDTPGGFLAIVTLPLGDAWNWKSELCKTREQFNQAVLNFQKAWEKELQQLIK